MALDGPRSSTDAIHSVPSPRCLSLAKVASQKRRDRPTSMEPRATRLEEKTCCLELAAADDVTLYYNDDIKKSSIARNKAVFAFDSNSPPKGKAAAPLAHGRVGGSDGARGARLPAAVRAAGVQCVLL